MNNAIYVIYRKIGEHKTNKRVWLQGQCLEDAGFGIGANYELDIINNQKIVLTLSSSGNRKVSQKKKPSQKLQPVVDLNNQLISAFFGQFERAKFTFFISGMIVITYHPTDELIVQRLNKVKEAVIERKVSIGSNAHGGGIMSSAINDGLAEAGFQGNMVFAIEKEHKYLDSSLKNSPVWTGSSLAIEGSMEEIELTLLNSVLLYEVGLPCTGASVAGRAKNKLKFAEQHESAGRLFYSFLSHIHQVNPAVVLLENVKQYANTISLHVILDVLDGWGYQTDDALRILNGRHFGAIENRERMFVVCPSKGLSFDWDWVESQQSFSSACVGDILDEVSQSSPLWSEMKGLKRKQLSDQAKGNSFKMQIVDSTTQSTPVIGRGYSKIRSTEPKLAHPTNKNLLRQFTVNEHARLKTIPEQLVSENSQTVAHEIMGQSVIYNLVMNIGQAIGQTLLNYDSNNEIKSLSVT